MVAVSLENKWQSVKRERCREYYYLVPFFSSRICSSSSYRGPELQCDGRFYRKITDMGVPMFYILE